MSNNYGWRRPTASSTVDVPRDITNLADDADATVKAVENRYRMGLSTARPAPTAGALYFDTDQNRMWVGINVSGTDWWVPFPGTKVCSLQQNTGQSIPNATYTPIVFHTEAQGDPFNVWSSGSRITPTFPGHYLFMGCVTFSNNATGYRISTWYVNGALAAATHANGGLPVGTGHAVVTRSFPRWMNGTTDYVELVGWQSSTAPLDTSTSGGFQTSASVIYLGAGKDATTP